MSFYTYILKFENGRFYTGITNNLKRRLEEHKTGKSISTKRFLPIVCYTFFVFESRKESRMLEVKIKNRGAKLYTFDKYWINVF